MADAAEIAQEFHRVYEELAPSFGYHTRYGTRVFDSDTPNGKLMIAVCGRVVCARLAAAEARVKELEARVADREGSYEFLQEINRSHVADLERAEAELKAAREVVEAAKDLRCEEDGKGDKLWDALDRYDALKGEDK